MIPTHDLYDEPTTADFLHLADTFKRLGLPDLEAASVALADEDLRTFTWTGGDLG